MDMRSAAVGPVPAMASGYWLPTNLGQWRVFTGIRTRQCEQVWRGDDFGGASSQATATMNALASNRTCSQASASCAYTPARQQRRRTQTRNTCVVCSASMKPAVFINSCTGKMGQAVGEAARRAGLELIPYTFASTADGDRSKTVQVAGRSITVVPPGPARAELVKQLQQQHPNMITVDYTVPDVIHEMVDFYVQHRMPFVMGTTGGDRERINQQVKDSGVYAVIAPNMGKQIVAFQVRNAAAELVGPAAALSLSFRLSKPGDQCEKAVTNSCHSDTSWTPILLRQPSIHPYVSWPFTPLHTTSHHFAPLHKAFSLYIVW